MADTKDKFKEIRLSTNPQPEALAELEIGNIVYLDGVVYTAREGVYMRVLEEGADLPLELPQVSAANFHCSPAAAPLDNPNSNKGYEVSAVTATASFRFSNG